MPIRLFLAALLVGLTGVSAFAQSYQTQFGDIKFDRSKGPASWSGAVEIEQATGALSLSLPLGPGIGARGLKFQPVLKGHWSPKLDTRTWCLNSKTNEWVSGTSVSNNGGFSLTPGYFNLLFDPSGDESVTSSDPSPVRIRSPRLTNYLAPDGFSGSLNPEEPDPGYLPTLVQAQALLQAYGFRSGWTIGHAVWQEATGGPKGYYIFRGPGGELVLGLVHPTLAPEQVCSPVIGTALKAVTSSLGTYYHFPGAILVINGGLGYHYQWRSNRYSQLDLTWVGQNLATTYNGEDPTWIGVRFVRHAAFAMASMRNRSGDRIEFTKPAAGSWTASWFTSLGDTGISICFDGTSLRYQGVSNPPQFHLEGVAIAWPNTNESLDGFSTTSSQTSALNDKGYDGFRECEVTAVVDDVSQDKVTIQYDRSPSTAGLNSFWSHPNKLIFPGKTVTLTWDLYEYFRNLPDFLNLVPDHYRWGNSPSCHGGEYYPALYAKGITGMTEMDLLGPSAGVSSAIRTTTYRRQVPLPNRTSIGSWLNTAFTVQTIYPDTSSTITRYVEPPSGPYSAATASLETNMRVLAFLKHQVAEIRHYGAGTNSAMDLLTNPAAGSPCLKALSQSAAHRVEWFDRWDLHTPTNPAGAFTRGAVPSATRKRVWDALNKTMQIEEQGDWDAVNLGWKTQWKVQQVQPAVPDTVTEFSGLAMTGASPAYANPGDGLLRKEARTFESKQESWILGRNLFEQKSTEADGTPGKAPTVVIPAALPPITKVYDSTLPMLDRLSEIQVGTSGAGVRTVFTYKGTEGMAAAQLATASLAGQNQNLTGPVGVSYEYDGSFGLLNRITPFGFSWGYGQTSDGLGRVTEQKDPNGLVNTYSWDGAGRLLGIQPPSPETGQTMTPDADSRGMVIQHAGQRTRLRFNAFGQLVLEQRSHDGSTWTSYRVHAYDAAGRKTGESIWLAGVGDESLGSRPNLTLSQSIPSFTAGHWECAQQDDQGNCIKGRYWEPDTYDSQPLSGLVLGTGFQYDAYGREIFRQDANGVATATSYGERSKSVSVGFSSDAATTHFVYDAAARLIKVVDPKGQVTSYAYDAADRLLELRQYSGSTGTGPGATGNGTTQVRRWAYDSLGRTILLDQPESGVTYYTAFTLLGKPGKTVYGLPKGWRPASPDAEDASATTVAGLKVLSTAFDSLGRPVAVTSNDATVRQVMAYDEFSHGLSLGKLTTASTAPSASRQLTYDGLNGRPSSLVHTIDGNRFELKLTWRNDGLLDSRTYPDGRIQGLHYDSAKALPNGTSLGAAWATTLAYEPVHWGLQGVTYPNNASTFLTYSNDQTRLKAMTHAIPAGVLRSWSYVYDTANRLMTDGEDYYGYDALGRLTTACVRDTGNVPPGQGILQQFSFDPFGNRTGMSTLLVSNWAVGAPPPSLPATTSPSGDSRDFRSFAMTASEVDGMAASNQIPGTAGGVSTGVGMDGYDAQGNLKHIYRTLGNSVTRLSMAYDALGRVVSLTDDARGITEFYSYDDEGLRCQIDIWRDGVLQSKRYMIYNEARQLMAEYDLVQE